MSLAFLFTLIVSCQEENNVEKGISGKSFLADYKLFQKDSISSVYYKTNNEGLLIDTLLIFNKKKSLVRGQIWKEGLLVRDSLSFPLFNMELDSSVDVYRYKSVCLFFDSVKIVSLNPQQIYNGDSSIIKLYNIPDIYALVMPVTKFIYDGKNRFKAVSSIDQCEEELWYQVWYKYVDYKSEKVTIPKSSMY